MRCYTYSLLIPILLLTLPIQAQPTEEFITTISRSALTPISGPAMADWSDYKLHWSTFSEDNQRFFVNYQQSDHFNMSDSRLSLGKSINAGPQQRYQLEFRSSDEKVLFPAFSLLAATNRKLNQQAILNLELQYDQFEKIDPNTLVIRYPEGIGLKAMLKYYTGSHLIIPSATYTIVDDNNQSDSANTLTAKYMYIYNDKNN
ncbi:MAG: hypothetical protein HUJ30_07350, partial [Gammaproteobacteria bacterium]|nr:hypothetical protein [Gammaproteobacteria bacterium]